RQSGRADLTVFDTHLELCLPAERQLSVCARFDACRKTDGTGLASFGIGGFTCADEAAFGFPRQDDAERAILAARSANLVKRHKLAGAPVVEHPVAKARVGFGPPEAAQIIAAPLDARRDGVASAAAAPAHREDGRQPAGGSPLQRASAGASVAR